MIRISFNEVYKLLIRIKQTLVSEKIHKPSLSCSKGSCVGSSIDSKCQKSSYTSIKNNYYFGINSFFALILLVIIFTSTAQLLHSEDLSVSAEFVKELSLPGINNSLLRPSQVISDPVSGELFIIDTGNDRIAIFDNEGTFRFEFYGMDKFGLAHDVATDIDGYIYILGSTKEGVKLFKFDYDGTFLNEINFKNYINSTNFRNIEIDNENNLVLFNSETREIAIFKNDGTLINSFEILDEIDRIVEREIVVKNITCKNNMIYVPVSNKGRVYIYDLQGTFIKQFGLQGTQVGNLNFPVAISLHESGIILVLDKLRFNIVCFNENGEFLGEFGGKGYRGGWFFHPNYMTINQNNNVVVSQIFDNRVQICSIPQFILDKVSTKKENQTEQSIQKLENIKNDSDKSINISQNLQINNITSLTGYNKQPFWRF